jgi:cysteinyl-tRNA synthetase
MSPVNARLRLYNTLTRAKEDFVPIDPSNVRMYVCGPTVYDYAHIGNARPVIVFDVLNRLLRHIYGADHVTYVRNITDVDDKINARAIRDFPDLPLNDAIRAVTEKTANQFFADVKALGCLDPDVQPRATDNIREMVAIIGKLLANGHAYIATGAEGREVLFAVNTMADYGQLSKRRLEDQQAGARIAVEGHKRNPGDFVLWKESAATEPGWHAEFADGARTETIFGRPGWHIECSAMSHRYLGETFDIHGGGLDLIFPHHENEIAQSRCAFGHEVMANVWMHNGFLQVEGEKMSKSLGNFVTINELLHTDKFGGRSWPGEVLRLAMLKTHYRQPIDWTVKALEEAEKTLDKWYSIVRDDEHPEDGIDEESVATLCDDLNTSAVLGLLHQIAAAEANIARPNPANPPIKRLRNTANLLGLLQSTESGWRRLKQASTEVDAGVVQPLITARLAARAAKNWAESDRIRDELLAMGIQLRDNKDGTTTWEVKR